MVLSISVFILFLHSSVSHRCCRRHCLSLLGWAYIRRWVDKVVRNIALGTLARWTFDTVTNVFALTCEEWADTGRVCIVQFGASSLAPRHNPQRHKHQNCFHFHCSPPGARIGQWNCCAYSPSNIGTWQDRIFSHKDGVALRMLAHNGWHTSGRFR